MKQQTTNWGRGAIAGMVGGLAGQLVMAPLFVNPLTQRVLFNPELQSELFIDAASGRNVPVSVLGLVILSAVHGLLYSRLKWAMPGRNWVQRGAFWGITIWLMYWLFQEWFVYVTLLGEPVLLATFELVLTAAGALVEGIIIAAFWRNDEGPV